MKAPFLTVLLLLVFFIASINAWERNYGGTNDDRAYSIVNSLDGGYVVAGNTGNNAWILKIDSLGDPIWSCTYGTLSNVFRVNSIALTPDSGYIVAGYAVLVSDGSSDIWVLKLNMRGDTLWTRTYANSATSYDNKAYSIITTPDGGYLVVGHTYFSTTSHWDAWVLKLNEVGDTLWTHTYGGEWDDRALCVAIAPDSGYVIAGYYTYEGLDYTYSNTWILKLLPNGDPIWTRTYGGRRETDAANSIAITPDGGYIVAGSTTPESMAPAAWVLKLNARGDTLWTHNYGSVASSWEYGNSIITTPDGRYLLAGYGPSLDGVSNDAWIMKINANGDTLWTRSYGGIGAEVANSIVPTPDGGYIASGYTNSFFAGNYDFYVIKMNSRGYSSFETSTQALPETSGLLAYSHADNLDLRITLPQRAQVHLDLLNSLGEAVATIADQALPAGESRLEVPCPRVPAGIYLIRSNGTLPTARVVVW